MKRNSTFVLVAVAAWVCSGCVSTKTTAIEKSRFEAYRGSSIVGTQRDKPSFAAQTAGKAMLGLVGAGAMISTGNEIIRDNQVADPADYINQTVIADLVRDDGLSHVNSSVTTDSTDVAQLSRQYSNADLLLDIQTVNWSFSYFPADWSHYRVIYSAKLRLIETKHAKLIAEGFCARIPEKTPDAPTREQLLDNQADGLKKQLAVAAEYCLHEFRNKVLKENLAGGP
jgi:hypothetical protein